MAGELLSFGLQKLWTQLSEEYTQFQGVKEQVDELKSDLNLLNSFLKDAQAKKHISSMVRNCVAEIKEIVYDAEDIIETFLLKEELGETNGVKNSIRRLACIVPDRKKISSDIGGISKRISKAISVMQSFGIQQIIVDGGYTHKLRDRQKEMRQTFSSDYETNLVGLEENVHKLVGYLAEEEDIQVVTITGMGGIGKTTLARQVFNHEIVKRKFDHLVWVCVSQEFTRKSVWQTILRNLKPKEEEKEILEMTESTLQGEIIQLLNLDASKLLFVLDDVWKSEDWELIKSIFPFQKKGWKVLLTSRNESVVVRGHGDGSHISFKPEYLSIENSWKLFEKIAFQTENLCEFTVDEMNKMKQMGERMVKHCGGLPLAVKVLGGLLAAKYTRQDWERLSDNIGSRIVGRIGFSDANNNNSINQVLSMSFEELSDDLKHCFLYLAHYPEDYAIPVKYLSYHWAAEEIYERRYYDGETIRDIGETYVEELVRRNMVISEKDGNTLRFETCHLHDMMREICLDKAQEENFLQIKGIRSSGSNSQSFGISRRFVWQNPTEIDVKRDINNPKLRSLMSLPGCELSVISFTQLELLRVLDLSNSTIKGRKLPSSIGKLIHLRYLSLKRAQVSHLPSSLRNLKLLIYLNLGGSTPIEGLFVPNVLNEMRELRYLQLPYFMNEKTKLELGNLVKLETLINFSTRNSSIEDINGMKSLRTFKIVASKGVSVKTLSASIAGRKYLETLHITEKITENGMKEITGFVLDSVSLKHLDLNMNMPILDGQHFPSYLTTIFLSYCQMEKDPLPILEKLFHLKKVTLGWKSFVEKRMVCSAGGFPQLQKLEFRVLSEWEEWIVEQGSMPLLHTLEIRNCKKLKEIPDGLRFITSLKDLTLFLEEQWKERVSEGGEDYYKVQHIPSVTVE